LGKCGIWKLYNILVLISVGDLITAMWQFSAGTFIVERILSAIRSQIMLFFYFNTILLEKQRWHGDFIVWQWWKNCSWSCNHSGTARLRQHFYVIWRWTVHIVCQKFWHYEVYIMICYSNTVVALPLFWGMLSCCLRLLTCTRVADCVVIVSACDLHFWPFVPQLCLRPRYTCCIHSAAVQHSLSPKSSPKLRPKSKLNQLAIFNVKTKQLRLSLPKRTSQFVIWAKYLLFDP